MNGFKFSSRILKTKVTLKKPVFCWWSFFQWQSQEESRVVCGKSQPVCCVGLSLARDPALGGVKCRSRGVQGGPSFALRVGAGGAGVTNCCSLGCSRVPANCCSSRPGASHGSEEMLCCQCWKSVHFDPAVFLTCQRLKTLIELSCAGSSIGETAAACPVDNHILLGVKQVPAPFHLY